MKSAEVFEHEKYKNLNKSWLISIENAHTILIRRKGVVLLPETSFPHTDFFDVVGIITTSAGKGIALVFPGVTNISEYKEFLESYDHSYSPTTGLIVRDIKRGDEKNDG